MNKYLEEARGLPRGQSSRRRVEELVGMGGRGEWPEKRERWGLSWCMSLSVKSREDVRPSKVPAQVVILHFMTVI